MRRQDARILGLTLALFGCRGEEAAPPDTETGSEADDHDADDTGDMCRGPDGCWECEPISSAELLDRCTDAACEPFANSPDRLPLLGDDGDLPPIP